MTTDQKVTLIRNGLPHNYHMPSTKDFFNGQTPFSGRTFSDGDHIYVYHRGNKFAASHVNIEHASTSPMPLPLKNIRRPPYGPHASCGSCPYSSLDVTHANAGSLPSAIPLAAIRTSLPVAFFALRFTPFRRLLSQSRAPHAVYRRLRIFSASSAGILTGRLFFNNT